MESVHRCISSHLYLYLNPYAQLASEMENVILRVLAMQNETSRSEIFQTWQTYHDVHLHKSLHVEFRDSLILHFLVGFAVATG